VLFGHHLHTPGRVSRSDADAVAEQALRKVLLWDQVKDKLRGNDNFLKRKLCRRNPDKFHLL